jgi:hypothetical protein
MTPEDEEFARIDAEIKRRQGDASQPAPVAWPCVIAEADFEQNTITLEMKCSDYKVGAGQHWLHTTPPAAQKPWVGLSEDEVNKLRHLVDWTAEWSYGRFAYELERLLREKNT